MTDDWSDDWDDGEDDWSSDVADPYAGSGGARGRADHGYVDQGYSDQGYVDRGYGDQGYVDQGYVDQGYSDQGYVDQGYVEDGYDDAYVEPGDWSDHKPPMSAGRKLLLAVGGLVAVGVVVLGVLYAWVQRQIDPAGEPGAEVPVEIASGSTTEDIGEALADQGVISSSMVWNYWTRLNDKGPFQAGEFVFQENSSFDEAVAVLDAGPKPPESDRVTIPEGLTVPEIAARLGDPETGLDRWSAEAFTAALAGTEIRSRFQPDNIVSMEGLLFPSTFEVADETTEAAFVRLLVDEMDGLLVELEAESRSAALGLSVYELLTVASLIEEEARVEGDRAKISRVIYNRLEQGIPLGIDATSRYEAELAGRSRDDIDFSSDSPYNTRRVAGLPPTPIAAPGRASIEAALTPEPGDWIFYVLADEAGNHFFTPSSAEFQRAKQECIRKNLGCG